MGILQKAKNEQAFLKMGIFGNAGAGKTTSCHYMAMGLAHKLEAKKPVAVLETEAGSDFLLPKYQAEKIELLRVKSHSLSDLLEAAKEAEKTCSVFICDSITHIWQDVCAGKLRKINEARAKKRLPALEKLEFQHWADVKREWANWTDWFLNSHIHCIVAGRAAGIFDFQENEDTGRKELIRTGTRMKAENEFGYEPSLLVEIERVQIPGRAGWSHRATILKDRTDTINGQVFDFTKPRKAYKKGDWEPTFKPFLPVIRALNITGEHFTFDSSRHSDELFSGPEGEGEGSNRAKLVTIALEEIQGTLVALWPGQDAESKKIKQSVIESVFGTRSWTAVESRSLEELQAAVKALRLFEEKNSGEKSVESILALLDECRNGGKQADLGELPEAFTPEVEQ